MKTAPNLMSKRVLPGRVRALLDESGFDYELRLGGRSIGVYIAGRRMVTMPNKSHINVPAERMLLAAVRKALREISAG